MRWTKRIYLGLLILLMVSQGCVRKTMRESANLSLIEADELRYLMQGDPPFFIIDVRPENRYLEGHIQGAVNVWRPDYSDSINGVHGMIASRDKVERLMKKLGVKTSQTIILYDDKGNPDAARLWWILKQYGHERVVLLNGGLKYWNMRNFEIDERTSEFEPGDFHFEKPKNMKWYASMDMIQDKLHEVKLIDTRSQEEFNGEMQKKGASQAGNVPNSIWIDYVNCFQKGQDGRLDYRFESERELKNIFSALSTDDEIIVYCHSGVRSAYVTFVLTQLLGYKNVRNYDGSWVEWSKHIAS